MVQVPAAPHSSRAAMFSAAKAAGFLSSAGALQPPVSQSGRSLPSGVALPTLAAPVSPVSAQSVQDAMKAKDLEFALKVEMADRQIRVQSVRVAAETEKKRRLTELTHNDKVCQPHYCTV